MALDGARLRYVDKDGAAVEVAAKGRSFQVGAYMSCDLLVGGKQGERLICEITRDAFGRVFLYNKSVSETIYLDDKAILQGNKRPLLHGGRITLLNQVYTWEFPKADELEDAPGTPERALPAAQGSSSCPSLKVSNINNMSLVRILFSFHYSINSDGEDNASIQDESMTELEGTLNVPSSPSTETSACDTPKVDLLEATQNKENTSSPPSSHKKLLKLCARSDVVITSFSPRETGVKVERSFTCVRKPATAAAANVLTPPSVYSTPKGVLSELNEDSCSLEPMDFVSPSTSRKVKRESSMYLIDLTTPTKLRPTAECSGGSPLVIDITKSATPPRSAKGPAQPKSGQTPRQLAGDTPKRTPQSLMKRALLTSTKKQIFANQAAAADSPGPTSRSSMLAMRRQCVTTPRRLPFHPHRQTPLHRREGDDELNRKKNTKTSPRKRHSQMLDSPRDNKLSQTRKSLAAAKRSPAVDKSNMLVAKARRSLYSPKCGSPKSEFPLTRDKCSNSCSTPEKDIDSNTDLSLTFTIIGVEECDDGNKTESAVSEISVAKGFNSRCSDRLLTPKNKTEDQMRMLLSHDEKGICSINYHTKAKISLAETEKTSPEGSILNVKFKEAHFKAGNGTQMEKVEITGQLESQSIIEESICEEVLSKWVEQSNKGMLLEPGIPLISPFYPLYLFVEPITGETVEVIEDDICEEVPTELKANYEDPIAVITATKATVGTHNDTPKIRRSLRRISIEQRARDATLKQNTRKTIVEFSKRQESSGCKPTRRVSFSDVGSRETNSPRRKRRLTEESLTLSAPSKQLLNTPLGTLDDSVSNIGVIVEEASNDHEDKFIDIDDEDYGNELPNKEDTDNIDHGLRHLLKTPKNCSTPRFKGLREMLRTPKTPASPILANVKELLESSEEGNITDNQLSINAGKELDAVLKTPSAGSIMVPNDPATAVLKSCSSYTSAATEYNLSMGNATLHLDRILLDLNANTDDTDAEINVTMISTATDPLGVSKQSIDTSKALFSTSRTTGSTRKDSLTNTTYKTSLQTDLHLSDYDEEIESSQTRSLATTEMSGIQLLDQTSDSMSCEPPSASNVDLRNDCVTTEKTNTLGSTFARDQAGDNSDTDTESDGLVEALVVSDDEEETPKKPEIDALNNKKNLNQNSTVKISQSPIIESTAKEEGSVEISLIEIDESASEINCVSISTTYDKSVIIAAHDINDSNASSKNTDPLAPKELSSVESNKVDSVQVTDDVTVEGQTIESASNQIGLSPADNDSKYITKDIKSQNSTHIENTKSVKNCHSSTDVASVSYQSDAIEVGTEEACDNAPSVDAEVEKAANDEQELTPTSETSRLTNTRDFKEKSITLENAPEIQGIDKQSLNTDVELSFECHGERPPANDEPEVTPKSETATLEKMHEIQCIDEQSSNKDVEPSVEYHGKEKAANDEQEVPPTSETSRLINTRDFKEKSITLEKVTEIQCIDKQSLNTDVELSVECHGERPPANDKPEVTPTSETYCTTDRGDFKKSTTLEKVHGIQCMDEQSLNTDVEPSVEYHGEETAANDEQEVTPTSETSRLTNTRDFKEKSTTLEKAPEIQGIDKQSLNTDVELSIEYHGEGPAANDEPEVTPTSETSCTTDRGDFKKSTTLEKVHGIQCMDEQSSNTDVEPSVEYHRKETAANDEQEVTPTSEKSRLTNTGDFKEKSTTLEKAPEIQCIDKQSLNTDVELSIEYHGEGPAANDEPEVTPTSETATLEKVHEIRRIDEQSSNKDVEPSVEYHGKETAANDEPEVTPTSETSCTTDSGDFKKSTTLEKVHGIQCMDEQSLNTDVEPSVGYHGKEKAGNDEPEVTPTSETSRLTNTRDFKEKSTTLEKAPEIQGIDKQSLNTDVELSIEYHGEGPAANDEPELTPTSETSCTTDRGDFKKSTTLEKVHGIQCMDEQSSNTDVEPSVEYHRKETAANDEQEVTPTSETSRLTNTGDFKEKSTTLKKAPEIQCIDKQSLNTDVELSVEYHGEGPAANDEQEVTPTSETSRLTNTRDFKEKSTTLEKAPEIQGIDKQSSNTDVELPVECHGERPPANDEPEVTPTSETATLDKVNEIQCIDEQFSNKDVEPSFEYHGKETAANDEQEVTPTFKTSRLTNTGDFKEKSTTLENAPEIQCIDKQSLNTDVELSIEYHGEGPAANDEPEVTPTLETSCTTDRRDFKKSTILEKMHGIQCMDEQSSNTDVEPSVEYHGKEKAANDEQEVTPTFETSRLTNTRDFKEKSITLKRAPEIQCIDKQSLNTDVELSVEYHGEGPAANDEQEVTSTSETPCLKNTGDFKEKSISLEKTTEIHCIDKQSLNTDVELSVEYHGEIGNVQLSKGVTIALSEKLKPTTDLEVPVLKAISNIELQEKPVAIELEPQALNVFSEVIELKINIRGRNSTAETKEFSELELRRSRKPSTGTEIGAKPKMLNMCWDEDGNKSSTDTKEMEVLTDKSDLVKVKSSSSTSVSAQLNTTDTVSVVESETIKTIPPILDKKADFVPEKSTTISGPEPEPLKEDKADFVGKEYTTASKPGSEPLKPLLEKEKQKMPRRGRKHTTGTASIAETETIKVIPEKEGHTIRRRCGTPTAETEKLSILDEKADFVHVKSTRSEPELPPLKPLLEGAKHKTPRRARKPTTETPIEAAPKTSKLLPEEKGHKTRRRGRKPTAETEELPELKDKPDFVEKESKESAYKPESEPLMTLLELEEHKTSRGGRKPTTETAIGAEPETSSMLCEEDGHKRRRRGRKPTTETEDFLVLADKSDLVKEKCTTSLKPESDQLVEEHKTRRRGWKSTAETQECPDLLEKSNFVKNELFTSSKLHSKPCMPVLEGVGAYIQLRRRRPTTDTAIEEELESLKAKEEKTTLRRGRKPTTEKDIAQVAENKPLTASDPETEPLNTISENEKKTQRRGRKPTTDTIEMPAKNVSQQLVPEIRLRQRVRKATDDDSHLTDQSEPKPKRRARNATVQTEPKSEDLVFSQSPEKISLRGQISGVDVIASTSADAIANPTDQKRTRRDRNASSNILVSTPVTKKQTVRRTRKADAVYEDELEQMNPQDFPTEQMAAVVETVTSFDMHKASGQIDEVVVTPRRREGRNLPRKNYDETSDEEKPGSNLRRTRKPVGTKAPIVDATLETPKLKSQNIDVDSPVNTDTATEQTQTQRREGRNLPRKNYAEVPDDDKPRNRRGRNASVKGLDLMVNTSPRPVPPMRRKGKMTDEKEPVSKMCLEESIHQLEANAEALEIQGLSEMKEVKPAKKTSRATIRKEKPEVLLDDQPPTKKTRGGSRTKIAAVVVEKTATDQEEPIKRPTARSRIHGAKVDEVLEHLEKPTQEPEPEAKSSTTARGGRARKVHFEATLPAVEGPSVEVAPKRATRSRKK
ncbi:hypothetical protein KR018_002688 [Drosophila ironensis]|nr:hypothetical protein KR018_002688 [Drosophila ironensis]